MDVSFDEANRARFESRRYTQPLEHIGWISSRPAPFAERATAAARSTVDE
eukprot:m.363031 g.363031  ORF g.363031 m.363031 type:complete len:50 (+) comp16652_c3_seq5:582-731(+)